MIKGVLLRLIGISVVVGLLVFAYRHETRGMSEFFDVSAALLVIFVPPLLLMIFSSSLPPLRFLWRRVRQVNQKPNSQLLDELEEQSQAAGSPVGLAKLLGWSSRQSDEMVRFGAQMVTSRYRTEELTHLFMQRLSFEDRQWQKAIEDVGFLAKTAPYNGMLATVMGMLHMLRTLEDLSQITASVGLALFGTLYGLVLFLLVYSPIERGLTGLRQDIRRRNEMIARWFIHMAEKRDSDFICDDLSAQVRESGDLAKRAAHA